MPPTNSQFKKAKDPGKGRYVHPCNPIHRPYALAKVTERDKQVVRCPKCGYTETWVFNNTNEQWIIV